MASSTSAPDLTPHSPAGIDAAGITGWFMAGVPDVRPPLHFTLIAGGRSNLTYRVEDAAGRTFALRRPPTSHVLPTAHDMVREHRLMSSLGPTDVPVPRTYGLCTDESVTGAPFFVMEFVDGHILRDAATVEKDFSEAARRGIGNNMADTLARLHAVDVDAVGLGDLGRRSGYIERQLRRWTDQYQNMSVEGVDHGGLIERVGATLASRVPEQRSTSIVHGDYRLDNVILDDQGGVRAILDWEICTLGDPLADLGLLMCYWAEAGDDTPVLLVAPTTAPGFATRREVLDRYAGASKRDVSNIDFYVAFGYWKLACILQGVYARYVAGAGAGDPNAVDEFPRQVDRLGELAAESLRVVSPDASAQPYQLHGEHPVRQPVLVTALEGWVDAGLGAATAAATLLSESHTEPLVTFDGDRFLDQRARRPVARIVNGVTTDLTWPRIEIRAGNDRAGADVLYLIGPEPDFHWREFVDAVVGLSLGWGVRMVVGLGAFPAPAPHTRPVKLAATAPPASSELVNRIGVVQGELEVPAGVQAALELGFGAVAVDTLSLWARVPHYVAAMPFPEASAALVDGLAGVAGLALDSASLHSAADDSRRQVDELIAANPEHLAMVQKLEESIDLSEGNPLGVSDLPSGDEIAAELEQFLRGEDQ